MAAWQQGQHANWYKGECSLSTAGAGHALRTMPLANIMSMATDRDAHSNELLAPHVRGHVVVSVATAACSRLSAHRILPNQTPPCRSPVAWLSTNLQNRREWSGSLWSINMEPRDLLLLLKAVNPCFMTL